MEITRTKGKESGYDYTLKEDNKELRIIFGGNLDLYWSLYITDKSKTLDNLYDEVYETFLITKENYQIYSLFKKLIEDIKQPIVFEPVEEELLVGLDSTESEEEKCARMNEDIKRSERYKMLYNGQEIIWHSDDDYYEEADRVKISEVDENILLEFYRPEQTLKTIGFKMPNTVSIRFRNSGSIYDPLNIVFMRMYQQLQEYNPDYHQIHLEEIIYKKTLKKKES